MKELEGAGYKCIGVDLPGNTNNPHKDDGSLFGISDDVAAIRTAVTKEIDSGRNVTLVTHSYSSIPGTASSRGLDAESRQSEGKSGHVQSIVIISGFLLPTGTTMLAVMGGKLAPQYLHEADTTLPFNGPGAIHVLYNDLDTVEAQKAVWRLKAQSYAINTSLIPDQGAGVKGIPIYYMLCSKDNAVPWEAQTGTVEGFRALGCDIYAEVAASGHSPFLSMPAETAKFIRTAAGEDLVTGLDEYEPK